MRAIAVLAMLEGLQDDLDRPEARLDASRIGVLVESLRAVADRGIPKPWRPKIRSALDMVQRKLGQALQRLDLDEPTVRLLEDLKAAVDRVAAAQAFAERLHEIRTRRGFTLRELADRSGVSLPSLHRLEAGGFAPPRPETIRRLAEALGVPEAELSGQPVARPDPALEHAVERVLMHERLEKSLALLTLPELGLADELIQVVVALRRRHLVVVMVETDEHAQAVQAMAETLRQDAAHAGLRLRLLRWLIQADEPTLRALARWVDERQRGKEERET